MVSPSFPQSFQTNPGIMPQLVQEVFLPIHTYNIATETVGGSEVLTAVL
jgi:hypothetical protein